METQLPCGKSSSILWKWKPLTLRSELPEEHSWYNASGPKMPTLGRFKRVNKVHRTGARNRIRVLHRGVIRPATERLRQRDIMGQTLFLVRPWQSNLPQAKQSLSRRLPQNRVIRLNLIWYIVLCMLIIPFI